MSSQPGEPVSRKKRRIESTTLINKSDSSKSNWMGQKKLGCSIEEKRQLVEPDFQPISVQRQCELLGLARASYYYQNVGESADNCA